MCVNLGAIVGSDLEATASLNLVLSDLMRVVHCLHLGWIQSRSCETASTLKSLSLAMPNSRIQAMEGPAKCCRSVYVSTTPMNLLAVN